MTSYDVVRAKNTTLRRIGTWATMWWALSCAYPVLLVWQSRVRYAASGSAGVRWSAWMTAIRQEFNHSIWLRAVLACIIIGWVAGAWLWLRTLARQNVSYGQAFKDLFLTVRK